MSSILFTGDFYPEGRILKMGQEAIYNDFLPTLKDCDLAVTNLECPLCPTTFQKLAKTGPNLRSEPSNISYLKAGGFSLVTLANNHILDYGAEGLLSTMKVCKENKIATVGVGSNIDEASEIYFHEFTDVKVAILNIAENEYSTTSSSKAGANGLNPIKNYYKIQEAKNNADQVVVVVHGGHEGYNLPSPRMQDTYRFFIDAGADAVVGHHTHCYSGYETYMNKPIFYSLGNFLFDYKRLRQDSKWTSGFAVKLEISKNKLDFKILPYIQSTIECIGILGLNKDKQLEFEKNLRKYNQLISDRQLLENSFKKFVESRQQNYLNYIEPFTHNRYYSFLYSKKLVPSFVSKLKKRLFLNLIRCESHRDILMGILNKQ